MKDLMYFLLSVLVGVLGAIVRIVYLFFPGFYVMDVLTFGFLAAALAYFRPKRWWLWTIVLITPAMLFIGVTVYNLGIDRLRNGVGTAHLLSSVLIPLAAGIGGLLVARKRNAGKPHAGTVA